MYNMGKGSYSNFYKREKIREGEYVYRIKRKRKIKNVLKRKKRSNANDYV